MKREYLIPIGVVGAFLFVNSSKNKSSSVILGDPIVPVVDASVYADRTRPQLPDSLGGRTQGVAQEQPQVVKAEKPNRRIVVYGTTWCPNCPAMKKVVQDLRDKGWREDQISYVDDTSRQSYSAYPAIVVYHNGEKTNVRFGKFNAFQLADQYNYLTPNEIRDRMRSFKGEIVTVNPPTYNSYLNHVTDPNSHEGRFYQKWQVEGFTAAELQKLHSTQHAGIHYGVGE